MYRRGDGGREGRGEDRCEVREETDEVDRRDEKVINEVDEHNEGQIALLRLTRFLLRFGGEVER